MTKHQNNYSLNEIINRSIPDLIKIGIQCNVGIPTNVNTLQMPTVGRLNGLGRCYLDPKNPKFGRVTTIDNFHKITSHINFRGQYELRILALKSLGLDRMPNTIWEENNNCISVTVYEMLEERGISLKKMKAKIYKKLAKEINSRINFIEYQYFMQFKRRINRENIEVFIKKAEISTDIETPIGYEMARDIFFKKQFDQVIHAIGYSYFKDKNKHAVSNPGAEVKQGANLIKQLVGYLPNKVLLKVYLKSKDQVGWLNRLESVYRDKSLDQILGFGRKLSEDSHMPYIGINYVLRKLTRIHAKRVYKILHQKPVSLKPEFMRLLKISLKNHCGSYWDDIYQVYRKWAVVCTGRGTSLPKTACRTVTRLAKEGVIFKKIKHPRATYRAARSLMVKDEGQF